VFSLQCLFCNHDNPVEAKYCMECGSQMNLKLCKQCEAINGRTAPSCHNCRGAFPPERVAKRPETGYPITEGVPSSTRSPHTRSGDAARPWRMFSLVSILIFAGITYLLYRQPSFAPNMTEAPQSAPAEVSLSDTPADSVGAGSSAEIADPPISKSMMQEENVEAMTLPLNETKPRIRQTKSASSATSASNQPVQAKPPAPMSSKERLRNRGEVFNRNDIIRPHP
jgi:ribosomal protein L40E